MTLLWLLCKIAGEPAIIVKGEFTWDLAAPATLMDIDVEIPAGGFVAVVGSTGASAAANWVLFARLAGD